MKIDELIDCVRASLRNNNCDYYQIQKTIAAIEEHFESGGTVDVTFTEDGKLTVNLQYKKEIPNEKLDVETFGEFEGNTAIFYGEVEASDFITGADLIKQVGLDPNNLQFSDEPWLKFNIDGVDLYITKKTYLHSVSMDTLLEHGLVNGEKTVTFNDKTYSVHLLNDKEWDLTLGYLHEVRGYTDQDLHTHYSNGRGTGSWVKNAFPLGRYIQCGRNGVSGFNFITSSSTDVFSGWRAVLKPTKK